MSWLPRRARLALHDWAVRYSGYDKHMAEAHPVPGYLEWGDVLFTIRTVTFEGGRMHIRADALASETGRVKGRVMLLGTDSRPVLSGTEDKDMGIKTSGTSWSFGWDVRLPGSRADDTPDAPSAP